MEKVLVSVFDSEAAAFDGLTALKDLHRDGDITLYASLVIAKQPDGTVETRQAADRGPLGTLVGLVGGALIGAVGGPAGLALGAYVGGASGVIYDLTRTGIELDFVDEVTAALAPGKTALVAEIDETWTAPVDARLDALHGTTFRRVPRQELEDELTRDVETARTELDRLHAEIQQSVADTRAELQARIEAYERKIDDLGTRIDRAIDNDQAELDAKTATLRLQWQTANTRTRTEVEGRIAQLQASYAERRAKLEHARELSTEARELRKEALLA